MAEKSSGTKKHKRNSTKCQKYRAAQKREKSNIAKIGKHIRQHPKDEQARTALKVWEGRLK